MSHARWNILSHNLNHKVVFLFQGFLIITVAAAHGASEGLTGKPKLWEVAVWEIEHLGSFLGKNP